MDYVPSFLGGTPAAPAVPGAPVPAPAPPSASGGFFGGITSFFSGGKKSGNSVTMANAYQAGNAQTAQAAQTVSPNAVDKI
jgi:hypothetical protein